MIFGGAEEDAGKGNGLEAEGEIVAAIHQNPPAHTVDAVKRRTRAGMGRCQSGFCTTYITELLAQELHMPEEHVVKDGKNAYMQLLR